MSYWESNGKTDEWYTPKYVFDALGCEFDLDVAAPNNFKHCCVPAKNLYHEKSLEKEWFGFVWMNPPFGGRNGLIPWLEKFFTHGNGIALVPDRTSAPWWQHYVTKSHYVLFVKGKIQFIDSHGCKGKQPSNGTTLFGIGSKAVESLTNAKNNGLGYLMKGA